MPRGKYLKLILGVDGTCSIDAIDFTGPACRVATQEIARALGGRVVQEHTKPEACIRERCGQAKREEAR
jgi:hypothetical protein